MPLAQFNDKYELIFALLNEIELAIGPDGYLYDINTKIQLRYNDKYIKASIDPNNPAYPAEHYALLDINDMKIMTMIFGYYLEKGQSLGFFNILSYWSNEPEGRMGPSSCSVKFSDGSVVTSKLYNNKALKFCDTILRMAGYDVDLTNFDLEWMRENDIKSKRRTK